MGQTLSDPITEKHTQSGADARFLYAVSEMQGWRIGMEDAHATVLQLGKDDPNAFFAVYDGHGGSSAAKFAGENVHKRLVSEESYAAKDYFAALKRAFLGTDEDLRSDSSFFRDPSGCTAVAALLTTDGKIFVANAGDSRSVLCVKGEAKPLSFDHKPQNEAESARIKAAGGYVEFGRVNGNLALSRAIGDFEFKQNQGLQPEQQIVTSDPEITQHDGDAEDEFLILACDGIWDCLTSQQVIDVVRREIANRKSLETICEEIMDRCLAPDSDINGGLGCDNMTFAIVAILNGRTKEQWYDWIAERVEKKYGYETPETLPELYAPSRVAAARERWSNPQPRNQGAFTRAGAAGGLGALARVFGSNITFHPTGGISNNANNLMFDHDESSDEYESGEEGMDSGGSPHNGVTDLHAPPQGDVNKFLRAQLEELKDDDADHADHASMMKAAWSTDADGDSAMSDPAVETPILNQSAIYSRRNNKAGQPGGDGNAPIGSSDGTHSPIISSSSQPTCTGSPLIRSPSPIHNLSRSPISLNGDRPLQGEAPPPPTDDNESKSTPQLSTKPAGDAPSDAVKAEGLADKSEDPLIAK